MQKRPPPQTLSPQRTEESPSPLILVIDDDRDTCEMYGQYLKFVGFRVVTATDGESGITLARTHRPAAIVMDLTMRPLDGWEATRRLKSGRSTAHIPVVACTGNFLGRHVERALEVGCDAYVVKPCLPEDLVREIRKVLARPARQAQA
jgi:two-component system, cell cycle response regulator DivK